MLFSMYYAGALMKNTGLLWANDANKDRCKAIVSNLHRMGIINSIITNYDGRAMPKVTHCFVQILNIFFKIRHVIHC